MASPGLSNGEVRSREWRDLCFECPWCKLRAIFFFLRLLIPGFIALLNVDRQDWSTF
jgi:hypothetical protein